MEALCAAKGVVPLDELFGVLAVAYARYTLYVLVDRQSLSLEELTDAVIGFEAKTTGSIATPTDHERVSVHLHHVVLPHLEALDLLAYDVDSQTITSTRAPGLASALGIEG